MQGRDGAVGVQFLCRLPNQLLPPSFTWLGMRTAVHRACRRAPEMQQRPLGERFLGRLLRRSLQQEPNLRVHPQVHQTLCHRSCLGVSIFIPWPHVHSPVCKHAAQGTPYLMPAQMSWGARG